MVNRISLANCVSDIKQERQESMYPTCPNCNQQNPASARFCSHCGGGLQLTANAAPAAGLRSLALWASAAVVLITATWTFQMAEDAAGPIGPTVAREFTVAKQKADALYDLIAPGDVRVIVSRHKAGVSFRGSMRETEIMASFAELLTRHDGDHPAGALVRMERARPTWTTNATYKLSKRHAKRLRRVLAFEDVPVLVSGSSRMVRVQASPSDQQTVSDLVNILLGVRDP